MKVLFFDYVYNKMTLMSNKSPIDHMLNLALATAINHYQFYLDAADAVETPQVKALLLVLAESEEEMMGKIQDMMATGILDEVESIVYTSFGPPDETPFDIWREDTDPRIFVCNKALRMEVKGYKFYRSISLRAKSEVVSRLFEYFAYVKTEQIKQLRKVCKTF